MFCGSNKTSLIQEAISFLALANERVDEGCSCNTGTDNEECVSVVSAVRACVRHYAVQRATELSISKQLMSDTPFNTGGQVASAATDDSDKTIVVSSISNVDAVTDWK